MEDSLRPHAHRLPPRRLISKCFRRNKRYISVKCALARVGFGSLVRVVESLDLMSTGRVPPVAPDSLGLGMASNVAAVHRGGISWPTFVSSIQKRPPCRRVVMLKHNLLTGTPCSSARGEGSTCCGLFADLRLRSFRSLRSSLREGFAFGGAKADTRRRHGKFPAKKSPRRSQYSAPLAHLYNCIIARRVNAKAPRAHLLTQHGKPTQ